MSTIAHATGRHRGLGSRPSGKTSTAIGRNSAMDKGHAIMNRSASTRSSAVGAPPSSRTWHNGSEQGAGGVTQTIGNEEPSERVERPVPGDERAAEREGEPHQPVADQERAQCRGPAEARGRAQRDGQQHLGNGEATEDDGAATKPGATAGHEPHSAAHDSRAPGISVPDLIRRSPERGGVRALLPDRREPEGRVEPGTAGPPLRRCSCLARSVPASSSWECSRSSTSLDRS